MPRCGQQKLPHPASSISISDSPLKLQNRMRRPFSPNLFLNITSTPHKANQNQQKHHLQHQLQTTLHLGKTVKYPTLVKVDGWARVRWLFCWALLWIDVERGWGMKGTGARVGERRGVKRLWPGKSLEHLLSLRHARFCQFIKHSPGSTSFHLHL